MIDIHREQILTLKDASKEIPGRVPGKTVSSSTVDRWVRIGVRGIKLEVAYIGGIRRTSREAIDRFFRALAEERDVPIMPADERFACEVAQAKLMARLAST
jgi:hypothetical protein